MEQGRRGVRADYQQGRDLERVLKDIMWLLPLESR